uniref:Uncharacterized protein n=1 Tax=Arundo donax TaxID=35708 RepID=A0A0A9A507_ARUDO
MLGLIHKIQTRAGASEEFFASYGVT